jgi:uncharacterized protein YcbK (DUF882 family)
MGSSERTAGHKPASLARVRGLVLGAAAAGLLASGFYMMPAADAGGETRTMTLYSVNTKEKLTTTYMVNGRHVPAELKKINHLLRDWRRNAVTTMDTETIDLMWELHADLGSKAPIHIISGYRSAETNAMLKNIGRNVAKKSMHVQGKAIDLYFPDVPTERLRNSALVRDIGGVGYYPRSGTSGFVHVDSGRVRHWPGIGSSQLAKIRRDFQRTVGARLGGDRPVQVASARQPEEGYPVPTPRPRPIEVLMVAAAQMVVQPAAAPAPAPSRNFAEVAARIEEPAEPKPIELSLIESRPTSLVQPKADLALAQMTVEPVAAPAPKHNFAARPSPVRDSLDTALAPEYEADLVVARIVERAQASAGADADGATNFLTALRDGIAAGAKQLISSAEGLFWEGTPHSTASERNSASVAAASEPFPPITEEDAAELEMIIAALRSRAQYDALNAERVQSAKAGRPAAKSDRLIAIRARKGDLILTAPVPRFITARAENAELEGPPVNEAAVRTFEKLLQADDKAQ